MGKTSHGSHHHVGYLAGQNMLLNPKALIPILLLALGSSYSHDFLKALGDPEKMVQNLWNEDAEDHLDHRCFL